MFSFFEFFSLQAMGQVICLAAFVEGCIISLSVIYKNNNKERVSADN